MMSGRQRLRIRLIAWNNGVGLSRDLLLMAAALRSLDHEVQVCGVGRGKLRKWFRPVLMRSRQLLSRFAGDGLFDLNIYLEHIRPEDMGRARLHVFVPNPEWCQAKDLGLVKKMDGVWVKTRHAEKLFEDAGAPVTFIGFTSDDRLDLTISREVQFFHLAGRSSNKGTAALIAFWRANPILPKLVLVQNPRAAREIEVECGNIDHRVDYVSEDELRVLQNASLFHLCPSETEGFGHYLVEAMSVGAIVLTTDAPPMSEFVANGRGICMPFSTTREQAMATTYHVDDVGFEYGVARALALGENERESMRLSARNWFVENDVGFPKRLESALKGLLDAS